MKRRLMIFDLDGVLFDTRDMHFETLNKALQRAGIAPISSFDHVTTFNGLPTRVKLELLGVTGEQAEFVKKHKQEETVRWIRANVTPNPKLIRLFMDLHDDGWYVSVASNAVQETVNITLKLLGLWGLSDPNFGANIGFRPKPDPQMYHEIMTLVGVGSRDTWIVEDSPQGIMGARVSGAGTIPVVGPEEVDCHVRLVMQAMNGHGG